MSGDMVEAEIERLEAENVRLTTECDNWQYRAETLERAVQVRTNQIHCLTAERDAAERERTESRAEVVRLMAECEGLRADLLAHPPELHQELAIERKRHLELMEDYDRQNVMIGILEDALKRAENALATAQAKRVNPRIPGYAAAIAQLASQIEDLLS
jgi:chromosome segregation ATPase